MAESMHSRGCVWQGACVAGGGVGEGVCVVQGMYDRRACVAGGMHGRGAYMAMRSLHGRGNAWQEGHVGHGICVHVWAWGMCGMGACMAGDMDGRGCVWQGGSIYGGGHVLQGACMTGEPACIPGEGGMHAGEMATQQDGKYPTRMLSCSECVFNPYGIFNKCINEENNRCFVN